MGGKKKLDITAADMVGPEWERGYECEDVEDKTRRGVWVGARSSK